MFRQSILRSWIVVGLVITYSATIPLLPILHTHETPSSNKSVEGAKKVASKNHPMYCETCLRINTTQIFANHVVYFRSILPGKIGIYQHDVDASTYSNRLPSLSRAPPGEIA
jgi:hypothetical protein